jgi:hypothetical protein
VFNFPHAECREELRSVFDEILASAAGPAARSCPHGDRRRAASAQTRAPAAVADALR